MTPHLEQGLDLLIPLQFFVLSDEFPGMVLIQHTGQVDENQLRHGHNDFLPRTDLFFTDQALRNLHDLDVGMTIGGHVLNPLKIPLA